MRVWSPERGGAEEWKKVGPAVKALGWDSGDLGEIPSCATDSLCDLAILGNNS